MSAYTSPPSLIIWTRLLRMDSLPWIGLSGPLRYSASSLKNRPRVEASPVGQAAVKAVMKSRTTSSALGGTPTRVIVAPLSLGVESTEGFRYGRVVLNA